MRQLYWQDDLSGAMGLGQVGTLGLVYQTYKMAFTPTWAQKIFITNNSNPNRPSPGSTSTSGNNLNSLLANNGGYINWQGSTVPGDTPIKLVDAVRIHDLFCCAILLARGTYRSVWEHDHL